MEHATHLGGALHVQDAHRLLVRGTAVHDQRKPTCSRQADLIAKGPPLHVPGRTIPIEIQPGFADGHHLVPPGQLRKLRQPVRGQRIRVVGMTADGRIDAVILFRERHRSPAGRKVRSHVDDRLDPGLEGAPYNHVPVLLESGIVKMSMRVY